jgi:hypothetical protein
MDIIKFIAGQAYSIFQYKNVRTKILKCCADISFNRKCLTNKVVPNYAKIKVPATSPASLVTQNKIHITRIKDEIKFLHMKKAKLNQQLYNIHLKAAQEWGNSCYIILDHINESINKNDKKNMKP